VNADEDVAAVVDIVARRVIASYLFGETIAELWEDYPELGANDWQAVLNQVDHIVERLNPLGGDYDAAYRFLAARADGAEA